MSDQQSLLVERAELHATIKELGDRSESWTEEDREDWTAKNERYDAVVEELQLLEERCQVAARVAALEGHPKPELFARSENGNRGEGTYFRSLRTGHEVRSYKPDEKIAEPGDDIDAGKYIAAWLTGEVSGLSQRAQQLMRQQQVGDPTLGGHLLPSPVWGQVVDFARSASVCFQAGAATLPFSGSATMAIARLTNDPSAAWVAELGAIPDDDLVLDQVVLAPKKVACIVTASNELLADAVNAGPMITSALQGALGAELDRVILEGSGVDPEPLGLEAATDINEVATVGTPTTYAEISAAVKAVLEGNYQGDISSLAWIAHPRDAATYEGFTDTTNQPLLPTPWAGQLRRFTTTSIDTTTNSSMFVGDFRQILVGMRGGLMIERLNTGVNVSGVNALTQDAVHFRATMRADVVTLHPKWLTKLTGVTAV